MKTVESTLQERHGLYGEFAGTAAVIRDIKSAMHRCAGWATLAPDQQESLDMIANKIGRILRGDANYPDSWHDISGYAHLVKRRLTGDPV